jgi:glycosyltransferase involved in cell wall biosynthesis
MSQYIRKADYVDVMIFAEGTYPYVRGGVSSWIHQLITQLSSFTFGICFIGSQESDYESMSYELPENLKHLEIHYLFTPYKKEKKSFKESDETIEVVRSLHKSFALSESVPEQIKKLSFFEEELTESYFLHSRGAWDYINEMYMKNCPDVPFIDYFWTLKNMHSPLWMLASVANNLPDCSMLHAPSTGYAGFVATLSSYNTGRPFIITEHGIYTRERKIDLMSTSWITYRKPMLLRQPEEFNYIKQIWINFFEHIGKFAYQGAERVFSLFPGAQEIQLNFGAEASKLEVIPNGVDVDRLNTTLQHRPEKVPMVITLIGRVVPIKDIKTFIRAMRIVVNTLPEVEGWIVGPVDEDKTYAEECFKMVESLGLKENVKFLGFQNIMDILPKTGIQTLTSISEGMPLVILEGFAAGVPCVATDVGSCRNLIEGALDDEDIAIGPAGVITKIANPSQLAEAYIELLGDEAVWQKAHKAALTRVNTYYRQEMFLEKYETYYKEAIKKWQA